MSRAELVVSPGPGRRWWVSLSISEEDCWEDISSSPTKTQAIRRAKNFKTILDEDIDIVIQEELDEETP